MIVLGLRAPLPCVSVYQIRVVNYVDNISNRKRPRLHWQNVSEFELSSSGHSFG